LFVDPERIVECQAPAEEIIVLAPRLPDAPGEQAYSAYSIDPALIEEAIRLDDALRAAPGVSLFRRSDSAAANPTIQGLSIRASAPSGAGRALVTLDGAPLNDPFGGWVIWGALPQETIAGATVLRGAGAGPYGAGALTGAVMLEERQGQGGATFSIESGDRGHARASGVGEARNDAFSLMLAAAAQREDGWVPVREGRGAADAPVWLDSFAGVARAQWRDGQRLLSLRLSAYGEERGAGLVGAESTSTGASASVTLADPAGAFAWRAQFWALASDLANSSVAVAPDRSVTTPANDQHATPALGLGGNAALRWTGESGGVEVGADLRAADGETREHFFFSGGDFTRARVAGGRTLTAGVYAETWREAGDWLFSGGARVDLYRAYDGSRTERVIADGTPTLQFYPDDSDSTAPTARVAFRRGVGALHARGALYAGFRPPTLNELHRPFRVGNDVTEANAALEPERLFGADFGVGGDHASWSWQAGLFATRLEDAIVNVTLGAGPGVFPPGVFVPAGGAYRQRQNAGSIDATGVEAEARGAWGEAIAWRAALTYADARVDGGDTAPALTGLRPAQSPEWSATAGLVWQATESLTLSGDVAYESARFEDDLNSRVLSASTAIDLRAQLELKEGVFLYAALDNVLDAEIETAETATGVESFGPPQTLRVGLRLRR
jgi:outer membrane receptor protein involved in Fe transport